MKPHMIRCAYSSCFERDCCVVGAEVKEGEHAPAGEEEEGVGTNQLGDRYLLGVPDLAYLTTTAKVRISYQSTSVECIYYLPTSYYRNTHRHDRERGEGKGNGHQHGVASSPSGSNNPAAAVQQTTSGCRRRCPTVPRLSSSRDLRIATVRVVLPGRIDVWA